MADRKTWYRVDRDDETKELNTDTKRAVNQPDGYHDTEEAATEAFLSWEATQTDASNPGTPEPSPNPEEGQAGEDSDVEASDTSEAKHPVKEFKHKTIRKQDPKMTPGARNAARHGRVPVEETEETEESEE